MRSSINDNSNSNSGYVRLRESKQAFVRVDMNEFVRAKTRILEGVAKLEATQAAIQCFKHEAVAMYGEQLQKIIQQLEQYETEVRVLEKQDAPSVDKFMKVTLAKVYGGIHFTSVSTLANWLATKLIPIAQESAQIQLAIKAAASSAQSSKDALKTPPSTGRALGVHESRSMMNSDEKDELYQSIQSTFGDYTDGGGDSSADVTDWGSNTDWSDATDSDVESDAKSDVDRGEGQFEVGQSGVFSPSYGTAPPSGFVSSNSIALFSDSGLRSDDVKVGSAAAFEKATKAALDGFKFDAESDEDGDIDTIEYKQ